MGLQLAVLPGLCTLGFGVLAGVAISISAIRAALQKYRSQMIWLILGLMLGSLYAIANGPASLATPRPAHLPACRLCVERYRAAGAGRCKNDDGT